MRGEQGTGFEGMKCCIIKIFQYLLLIFSLGRSKPALLTIVSNVNAEHPGNFPEIGHLILPSL
jgi:hypothetical protein